MRTAKILGALIVVMAGWGCSQSVPPEDSMAPQLQAAFHPASTGKN